MKNRVLICFLIILSFASCGDNITDSPMKTGTLHGYAFLDGQSEHSDIQITIGDSVQVVFTDSLGKWVVNNLEQGIYNILFSKDGYGYHKYINYEFVGNGNDYFYIDYINHKSVTLYKIPAIEISNFQAYWESDYIYYSGSFSDTTTEYFYISLFLGTDKDVSYKENHHVFFDFEYAAEKTQFSEHYPCDINVFNQDSVLYAVAYVVDPRAGYSIPSLDYGWPTVNDGERTGFGPPSEVIKIKLP